MARRNQRPLLLFFVFLTAGAGLATAQAPAPDLSDQEVAHVAVTANSIDIELAKYVQTRTRNTEVRKFAATMIADHSAVNAQAAALAGRAGSGKIVCIVSGGNIDRDRFAAIIRGELPS